ncbi:hypothetical protein I553_6621 [Mycobacterium xenopi 4042]|uniref:Uncharacterized protein n=1 Tax=Mycobacterium xenopi 4042 TaxID=1299334 RepID=X8BH27_MYCXE|nr:hypothetical protein I553_6621 [Mycobacterium xenopi 4042]
MTNQKATSIQTTRHRRSGLLRCHRGKPALLYGVGDTRVGGAGGDPGVSSVLDTETC